MSELDQTIEELEAEVLAELEEVLLMMRLKRVRCLQKKTIRKMKMVMVMILEINDPD